ncbi:hypothetical protein C8Q70DRAFT_918106 [Cubamyces menziesii]|nr:hypothetical protein C8Q70DRAFT_918106 [Cubamyces menziesii]
MSTVTNQLIVIIRTAIDIFASRGLKCCLVGSVASYGYGVPRTPNDIDLVVLTNLYGQETLKSMLVAADSSFYLVPSRNPRATYKVLWYRNAATFSLSWKVDILLPGIMNIPNVPRDRIVSKSPHHIPLMPLMPHLLLKLQAWSDHRASHRSDQRFKQYTDVRDIDQLLDIALRRREHIRSASLDWLPQSMITAAITRLRSFVVHAYGGDRERAAKWRRLGFDI